MSDISAHPGKPICNRKEPLRIGRLFCYREGDVKAHSLLAVEWHQSKSFESCRGCLAGDPSGEAASAPPLGELLSECEAEGVYCVGCCRLIVSTAPIGEALSLPQRRSRLGSPRGCCRAQRFFQNDLPGAIIPRLKAAERSEAEGFTHSVDEQTPPPHVRSAPPLRLALRNRRYTPFIAPHSLCDSLRAARGFFVTPPG